MLPVKQITSCSARLFCQHPARLCAENISRLNLQKSAGQKDVLTVLRLQPANRFVQPKPASAVGRRFAHARRAIRI